MTKITKIKRFELDKEADDALFVLQNLVFDKARELVRMQENIEQTAKGCVSNAMLMAEGTLEFQHGNLDVIKNAIAEQRRQNDKLLDDVRLLEWSFIQLKIDESKGK